MFGDFITTDMEIVEAQTPVDREQLKYGQTRRGLKSRHIQFIALGGCIGTGLFIGTGSTLSLAGPAPLFFCKSIILSYDGAAFPLLLKQKLHSVPNHVRHRLGRHAKSGRDDNLSSYSRRLGFYIYKPLFVSIARVCCWVELLVFVCAGGRGGAIGGEYCDWVLGESCVCISPPLSSLF